VDVGALAAGCAASAGADENAGDARKCFGEDGVHAVRAVYDAAAQLIADAIVRETNESV
jgi:hypothetical protein